MNPALDPQQVMVIRAVAVLAASISVGGGQAADEAGRVRHHPIPTADLIARADHIANYIREGRLSA